MRQTSVRWWLVVSLVLLINIGGWVWVRQAIVASRTTASSDAVTVRLATKDVDDAERLTFQFDKPVAGAKQPNEPVAAAPLRLEPLPLGYWEWRTPMRLDYVLAAPLKGGQAYRVVPVANFNASSDSGAVDVQTDGDIEIRTKPLELRDCQFLTTDREVVSLVFTFSQPVDPGDLVRHLTITEAPALQRPGTEKQTAERVRTLHATTPESKPSARLVVRCERPMGTQIDVVVAKDLKGHGAEIGLENAVNRSITVTRRCHLLRAQCYHCAVGRDTEVYLQFSQPLDENQVLPTITLEPKVEGVHARIAGYNDSTIVLTGPFEPQVYSIEVAANLLAADQTTLAQAQRVEVTVPERQPTVQFANRAGFLSPHGNLLLDLETVNVSGLRFEISQVFRNNLISHLNNDPVSRTARPLTQHETSVGGARNAVQSSTVELKKLIGDRRGIFHIRAAAADKTWTDDNAVVTVTDLGLTAKREKGGLHAWITSLKSSRPVGGVQVTALSFNNQVLVSGVTNPDGTVHLKIDEEHAAGRPWALVAEHGEETSYLQLDRSEWVLDDIDQSGKVAPENYDALLYSERGVYRPGEKVHVAGVLRDARGQTPPAFPLHVTVRRPDRRIADEFDVTPEATANGTFSFDVPTRDTAPTGPYRISLTLPGSDTVIGSMTTLVEAFEPVRIEVLAEAEKPVVSADETAAINVTGKYLFGQPAANLALAVTGQFHREAFVSKASPGFSFGESSQFNVREVPSVDLQLDETGQLRVEIAPPDGLPSGWWRGRFLATVTETGGRSTSKGVTFHLDSAGRHIGLRRDSNDIAPIGKPINVEWVVRDGADALAAPAALTLELMRVEYDWMLRRHGEGQTWASTERLIPVSTETLGVNSSAGKTTVTCPSWGKYRLVATDSKSGSRTRMEWYASSPDLGDSVLSLNRPERVEVILDRASYVPGTTAKVLIRSPFAGMALVSLESNTLHNQQVVELTGQSMTVDLAVPANLRGGAFVNVSVLRPIDSTQKTWLPHRASGLARLTVDHSANRLPVTLNVPSQTRPSSTVKVELQVESQQRPARVHVWAVDEGILLTTAFRTPDPMRHFLAPRKLEMVTCDLFSDLLPDHLRPASMSRIGGDDDGSPEDMTGGRRPSKHRESVVVWRSWESTDASGQLSFEVPIPEYTGRLRWMAVAIQDDRYGSAESATTVTSPLLVEASWPRFAAPGDQFKVPVKLFNSTEQELTVSLETDVDGPVSVGPPADGSTVQVRPGHPELRWLEVTATGLGDVSIGVRATSKSTEHGDLNNRQSGKFTVRAISTRATESFVKVVRAGQPVTLDVPNGFLPENSQQTLIISAHPQQQLLPAVNELIDYPYGCVEQTSSRISALLAASQVLSQSAATTGRREAADDMIQAGLSRLWSMQTVSGGLGYWTGGRPSVWGTTYAASVVAECQQRGIPIEPSFQRELLKYLTAVLDGRSNGNEGLTHNQRAQIVRVLAVFKNPQVGWMSKLSENVAHLDALGRADLASAWFHSGRRDRAMAVLLPDTREQIGPESWHDRITSPLQQQAALLKTLIEIAPEHEWVPQLAASIEAARKNGAWRSTIENAAAISALSSFYQFSNPEPAKLSGVVRSAQQGPTNFDSNSMTTLSLKSPLGPLSLESTGTGSFFATLTTTGLKSKDTIKPIDRGLEVRRSWSKTDNIRVGDLIQVTVTFRSLDQRALENVVVTDALPAGFEVENPRLSTSATTGDVPSVDRIDFLDDRVLVFDTAHQHLKTISYFVRATTVGTFEHPPIQAVSMYAPEFASTSQIDSITVAP